MVKVDRVVAQILPSMEYAASMIPVNASEAGEEYYYSDTLRVP